MIAQAPPLYFQRHDATGNPSSLGFFHGPDGLLRWPGVDPALYHTIVGNYPGLLGSIPATPTRFINTTMTVITGIRDGSGDEPDDVCDDAPIGGNFKKTTVVSPWGRYMRQTQEIDIGNLGWLNDRAEPMDLRLANSLPQLTPLANATGAPTDILTNEMNRVFYERAVAFNRLLQRQMWEADPVNNNAGGGYLEFAGMLKQLATNWKDAFTNVAQPALNPIIRSFGDQAVHTNPGGLVESLTSAMFLLRDLADRTNMTSVRWVFFMRPSMWYEITKVWPCSYLTQACNAGGDLVFNVDQRSIVEDRDRMRNSRRLLIDGIEYEVVLDDAIPETEPVRGIFESEIYILPLSVNGTATLYLQYRDFGNPAISSALATNEVIGRVIGDGAFLEVASQTNYCIKFQARIEPRLVFRTPWLAFRLSDVRYAPYQQPRQPFPDDPYYVNGGSQSEPGPSYYRPW